MASLVNCHRNAQNRSGYPPGSTTLQMNPAYAQALKQTGGTDVRGVVTDLGRIVVNSLLSVRSMANATLDSLSQYGIVLGSEAKAGAEIVTMCPTER